jgi:succinate dehydrogenase/fumarate reductase flavoprotein subunit
VVVTAGLAAAVAVLTVVQRPLLVELLDLARRRRLTTT